MVASSASCYGRGVSSDFDIRVAGLDDLGAMALLYDGFIGSQFELGGFGMRNPDFDVHRYVAGRLSNRAFTVFLATCDGVPAGFSDCSVQWVHGGADPVTITGVRPLLRSLRERWRARQSNSYLEPARQGYLHNSYVDPAFRQRGLGRELTRVRVEELQRRGADVILVHTLANNVYAQRVFTANGFRPQTLLMRWMPPDERAAYDAANGADES